MSQRMMIGAQDDQVIIAVILSLGILVDMVNDDQGQSVNIPADTASSITIIEQFFVDLGRDRLSLGLG